MRGSGGARNKIERYRERERERESSPLPLSTQASREFDLGIKTDPNLRPYFAKLQFPALGLPIVPRTHFRTHRTRRWAPTNPAATAAALSVGASENKYPAVKDRSSRLLERPGRVIASIARSQDTRTDSNIVGFEVRYFLSLRANLLRCHLRFKFFFFLQIS